MIVFDDDGVADSAELLDIYAGCGWTNYTKSPDAVSRGAANSLRIITARENGVLTGFARLLGDGESLIIIQDLIVRPEYRRRGIGSELLARAERAFPEARMLMLMTDSDSDNVNFYENRGYVKIARARLEALIKRPPRKAILVFIDGTLADDRERIARGESPMSDIPVAGAVECLRALSDRYEIVYIGARGAALYDITRKWLDKCGFPPGEVLLNEDMDERVSLAKAAMKRHNITIGIGDRYDDSAMHQEIGARSIIIQEYAGDWESVKRWLND